MQVNSIPGIKVSNILVVACGSYVGAIDYEHGINLLFVHVVLHIKQIIFLEYKINS